MAKKRAKKSVLKVSFEGVTYELPKITRGRETTSEQKLEIAALVCLMYSTDRYPLLECLKTCGIRSTSTWFKWQNENEQIEKLYLEAQEAKDKVYRSNARERARTTIERYLEGFTYTTVEKKREKNEKGRLVITETKEREIYIRPSIRAAEFVLTNFDGRNFTKNPAPYQSGNDQLPSSITFVVKGGYKPPVTNEDDINENPERPGPGTS